MFLNVDSNVLIQTLFSLAIIFIILLFYYRKSKNHISLFQKYEQLTKDHKEFLRRYSDIVDIDETLNMRRSELNSKENSIIHLQNEYIDKEKKLNDDYDCSQR